jgi:hypothetical protein
MTLRNFDIPPLEGYTSLPDAADLLDVKRQRTYQMGVEEGSFATIRFIAGSGDRPAAYVVQNAELLWFRKSQCPACQALADAGDDVLYCAHTGKDVPEYQVAELRARLKAREAAPARA